MSNDPFDVYPGAPLDDPEPAQLGPVPREHDPFLVDLAAIGQDGGQPVAGTDPFLGRPHADSASAPPDHAMGHTGDVIHRPPPPAHMCRPYDDHHAVELKAHEVIAERAIQDRHLSPQAVHDAVLDIQRLVNAEGFHRLPAGDRERVLERLGALAWCDTQNRLAAEARHPSISAADGPGVAVGTEEAARHDPVTMLDEMKHLGPFQAVAFALTRLTTVDEHGNAPSVREALDRAHTAGEIGDNVLELMHKWESRRAKSDPYGLGRSPR